MFKLVPDPIFPVRVRITVPGQANLADLVLTCRHKPRDALKAWIESAKNSIASDAQFIGEIVEGWAENVQGADGQPLPFTQDALAALLNNYPAAGSEIVDAYVKEISESRAKT